MEKRQETLLVKTYHCRPDGRMKIHVLMHRLQEIAAAHAQTLGLGIQWLSEMDCCWVLSNFVMEIARMPRWDETVTLQTWPSGHNRLIATREFMGHAADGSELLRAGSQWRILNRKTGRPINLAKLTPPLPGDAEKVISPSLERLEPPADCEYSETIRVPYSAIDMNGHVNNTEYVRWGMDVLQRRLRTGPDVRRLQITYLSEVFEDDNLELSALAVGLRRYMVTGRKAADHAMVYLMQVEC